jgi:hypothetical protein
MPGYESEEFSGPIMTLQPDAKMPVLNLPIAAKPLAPQTPPLNFS